MRRHRHQRARRWFKRAKAVSPRQRGTLARDARKYADGLGRPPLCRAGRTLLCQGPAREGRPLLAVATIAAAIGAAALESRRPDSRVHARFAKI
jgi:hypothetical protein